MAFRFATVVVAAVAIIVIVLGSSAPFTLGQRWLVLAPQSVFGVAGWALLAVVPNRAPARAVVGILVFIAAMAIAALSAPTQTLSFAALWRVTTFCGIACGVWIALSYPRGHAATLMIVTGLSVVLVAAYAFDVARLWLEWIGLGMEAGTIPLRPGLRGGLAPASTLLGDYILVLVPVACVALSRTGRFGIAAAAVLALAATACVVVVGARSIWLSAAIVGLVVAVVWLNRRGQGPSRRTAVIGVGAVVLGVLLVVGLGARSARDLDEGRSSAYASAISIVRDNPIAGSGPGTFGLERLAHEVDRLAIYVLPSALNPLLTTVAETGLVGMIAGVIAVTLVGVSVIKRWRARDIDRPIAIAALAGFGALAIHGQVDAIFDVPGLALASMTMLGLCLVSPSPGPVPAKDSDLFVRTSAVVTLIVLAALVPTFVRLEAAVLAQHDGVLAMLRGDLSVALDRAAAATEVEPRFVPGRHLDLVARDRAGQIVAALTEAREVVRLEDMAQHRLRLALLLERNGQVDEAASEFDAMADRLPMDPLVSMNAAAFSARRGDVDSATKRLSDAYLVAPGLVSLRTTRDLSRVVPGAYEMTVDRLVDRGQRDVAIRLAAWHGDTRTARELASSVDPEARQLVSVALDAVDALPGAAEELDAIAASNPTRLGAAGWAWLAAVSRCDVPAAARWQRVAFIATGTLNDDPGRMIEVPEDWSDRGPSRYPRAIWGVIPVLDGDVIGTLSWTTDLTPVCE